MTAGRGDARSTRNAYRDALAALMAADRRVVCLDSDTGLFDGTDPTAPVGSRPGRGGRPDR